MTDPYAAPDLDALLAQVRRQTEDVLRIQRAVEAMEVKAASRHNEVSVVVRGDGRFTAIDIDPRAIREYDPRALSALVLEAVNAGLRRLAEASSVKFESVVKDS
ncbi:MAG TPA: YbaB/EbfC family nucleoid-associated protein [Amycolatopsis sp.]|nr:YbaB/EbfC family nucleoid-associated protein [Amycolatopsis sp.]